MATETGETEAHQIMRELLALLRITPRESVTSLLKAELTKVPTLKAYLASDGRSTQRQVAKQAGVGQATVSRLWQRWLAFGLAVEADDGRAKALFDPEVYGVTNQSIRSPAR